MHFEAGSRNPLKSPQPPTDLHSPADKLSQSREQAVNMEFWQDGAGAPGCIHGPIHPKSSSSCGMCFVSPNAAAHSAGCIFNWENEQVTERCGGPCAVLLAAGWDT